MTTTMTQICSLIPFHYYFFVQKCRNPKQVSSLVFIKGKFSRFFCPQPLEFVPELDDNATIPGKSETLRLWPLEIGLCAHLAWAHHPLLGPDWAPMFQCLMLDYSHQDHFIKKLMMGLGMIIIKHCCGNDDIKTVSDNFHSVLAWSGISHEQLE